MMKFRRIKGDIENYRKCFRTESHRSMGYYSMELIKLEDIAKNPIDNFEKINFVLMQHLKIKRGSMNLNEQFLHTTVERNLSTRNKVDSIRNYNMSFLNQRQIVLLNPLVIKDIPKSIQPYLLSKDLFDVGWNLAEHHFYDQFVKHIQQNLPTLQRKYGQIS
jgi:hypothetical protein